MSARILIVDDYPANRKLMSYLLESRGHHTQLAVTGEEALELTRHEAFDLILCDIRMAGIDGYEVARRLRADPKTCRTPLVAITALAHQGAREDVISAGFDGFVSKGTAPQLFIQQVEDFLARGERNPPTIEPPRSSPENC